MQIEKVLVIHFSWFVESFRFGGSL